jgi:hypothetical protein
VPQVMNLELVSQARGQILYTPANMKVFPLFEVLTPHIRSVYPPGAVHA